MPSVRIQRFQAVELPADVRSADQRAYGGPADDVGPYTRLLQRADDADMRPAARRATAEREADARLAFR